MCNLNAGLAAASHPQQASNADVLLTHYEELVQAQKLKPDAQQKACLKQLNHLCNQLQAYSHEVDSFEEQSVQYEVQPSCLYLKAPAWLFWMSTHSCTTPHRPSWHSCGLS